MKGQNARWNDKAIHMVNNCCSEPGAATRIQKLKENGFIELWRSVGAALEV